MLELVRTKRTDSRILECMKEHYSQPKGFVGRNLCYAILFAGAYHGHIVGGSATLHLAGRNEFFAAERNAGTLNNFVNNIFYHAVKREGRYPARNFTERVLKEYRAVIERDWLSQYGDRVLGHETLVELPRSGVCYLRDGWTEVGMTKGFTCKRGAGEGSDGWSGKRVWDTVNLRPKRVFCRRVEL